MRKFAGLELLRFLCAFSVVVWHYHQFLIKGLRNGDGVPVALSSLPFHVQLGMFERGGYLAVQIFWMISGFIFFWKYSERIRDRLIGAQEFFVWRFSRLYPLHLATLALVLILQELYQTDHGRNFVYSDNDPSHFLMQLLFVSNWSDYSPFTFNGPVWSISVEVAVYMIFFVSVRFTPNRTALCLAMAVLSLIVMREPFIKISTCVLYFFLGGMLFRLIEMIDDREKSCFFASAAAAGAILGLASISVIELNGPMLVVFCFALVMAAILLEKVVGRDLSKLTLLGNLTYSSYLLHFPMQLLLVLGLDRMGVDRGVFLSKISFLLYLVLTFGVAWVVHRHFELPAQNAIRALWSRHSARARTRATHTALS